MNKKILNNKEEIVQEMLSGIEAAYSHKLIWEKEENVLYRKHIEEGKVGLMIGNGSGHEPACVGFVGTNMLDANIVGNIFAAPGPFGILEGIKKVDKGNGTVVIISQHAGDILNSKMGVDMAHDEGYDARVVIVHDDVVSAPKEEMSERRGTIGTLFVYKMLGGYAADMHNIDEVVSFGKDVVNNTRSIGMANVPGTSPVNGELMFELADNQIEIGLGVHGESAAETVSSTSSKEIASIMLEKLLEDIEHSEGDEFGVIVNSMGQTTLAELHVFFKGINELMINKKLKVFRPLIGEFVTSQEMGGIALSICKLNNEMKKHWVKDTDATHFPKL